jgi:hypothetical protein
MKMFGSFARFFAGAWDSLDVPLFRPRPYSMRVVEGRDGFGNRLYAIQIYSPNFHTWKWFSDGALRGGPLWVDSGDGALLFFSREDAQARLEAVRRAFREESDEAAAKECKVVWR